MTCDEIYNENEVMGRQKSNITVAQAVECFLKEVGEKNIITPDLPCKNANDLFCFIQNYIYDSKYNDLFFKILYAYGYNPKNQIIDAMHILATLDNPRYNKATIYHLLKSPVINDISYHRGNFEFNSELGTFNYTLAEHYFRKNKAIKKYIKRQKLPNYCHKHAAFLASELPDFFAITSLCPRYFSGSYYHSYTLDLEGNNIIDLCYNAVMNRDEYDFLFEPEVISLVLNSLINEELEITLNETNQAQKRYELLKIALYKQSLSDYQDNTKPKVLSLIKK